METSLLLVVFGLLRLAAGQETTLTFKETKSVSISTTITVDWLFTPPGLTSPTPETTPITIVSTVHYEPYTLTSSSSSSTAEAYYPFPVESSLESEVGIVTSASCYYFTVTSEAAVTPTTLLTTKAVTRQITITTMTTEAYSTVGTTSSSTSYATPSIISDCTAKHDPLCRAGHLTEIQPPAETPPFTILTSWKREVKTAGGEDDVDMGFIGQEKKDEESSGGNNVEAWGLWMVVAGFFVLF